jgi:hypothetical protein
MGMETGNNPHPDQEPLGGIEKEVANLLKGLDFDGFDEPDEPINTKPTTSCLSEFEKEHDPERISTVEAMGLLAQIYPKVIDKFNQEPGEVRKKYLLPRGLRLLKIVSHKKWWKYQVKPLKLQFILQIMYILK